jgi:hypothetical protein
MPKYEVHVSAICEDNETIHPGGVIRIKADNEAAAEEKAIEELWNNKLDSSNFSPLVIVEEILEYREEDENQDANPNT